MIKQTEIRTLRKSLPLTKVQFCSLFGISATTLTYWETGQRKTPALYMFYLDVLQFEIKYKERAFPLYILEFQEFETRLRLFSNWLFNNNNKK